MSLAAVIRLEVSAALSDVFEKWVHEVLFLGEQRVDVELEPSASAGVAHADGVSLRNVRVLLAAEAVVLERRGW